MGTKSFPGMFDCYDEAKPDEPLFTLLARDPLAPHLVKMWAMMRKGQPLQALDIFNNMVCTIGNKYIDSPSNVEKIDEANACAEDMIAWLDAGNHA